MEATGGTDQRTDPALVATQHQDKQAIYHDSFMPTGSYWRQCIEGINCARFAMYSSAGQSGKNRNGNAVAAVAGAGYNSALSRNRVALQGLTKGALLFPVETPTLAVRTFAGCFDNLAGSPRSSFEGTEDTPLVAAKKPAKKAAKATKKPAAKAAPKKSAAKKPVAKPAAKKAAPAKKPVAKKPVAKKAVPAKKPVAKKVVPVKAPAKKVVPAKKAAPVKAAPVKNTPAKAAPAPAAKPATVVKKPAARPATKSAPVNAAPAAPAKAAAPAKPAVSKSVETAKKAPAGTSVVGNVPSRPAPPQRPAGKVAVAVAATRDKAPAPRGKVKVVEYKTDEATGRPIVPKGYVPSPDEEYMSPLQLEYFRQRLLQWRADLVEESKQTIENLKDEVRDVGDEAERATRETENSLELRTRDRYRKLISKIDSTLKRVDSGDYGFCVDTGEEIGLERLEARLTAERTIDAQERWEHMQKQMGD